MRNTLLCLLCVTMFAFIGCAPKKEPAPSVPPTGEESMTPDSAMDDVDEATPDEQQPVDGLPAPTEAAPAVESPAAPETPAPELPALTAPATEEKPAETPEAPAETPTAPAEEKPAEGSADAPAQGSILGALGNSLRKAAGQ